MSEPITERDLKQKEYLAILENVNLAFLEGYNVSQILFNETVYCFNVSLKGLLKLFIKSLLFKNYVLECKIERKDILLLYSKNYRKDHDGYWEKIKEDVTEYDSVTILVSEKKKLDLERFIRNIEYFQQSMKGLKEINSIKDRVFFASKLVERKKVLDDIEIKKLTPKVVMCFSDNSVDENVLMQYFKSINAITVTNQHGLCIFQSYEYDRLNQSQILNFKCDYFLARGYKQKEQFLLAGYDSDRIKVVGYIGDVSKEIPIQNNNCIGIYLDCPTNPCSKTNNERMINCAKQIAKTLKISYLIKCHPQDSIENYQDLIDDSCVGIYGKETTLNETFEKVDICMTHASATYVDVYMYGLRCLKMNSDIRYPIATKEDEFDSVDCAVELICKWKAKSINEQKQYIKSIREEYASPWIDGNINNILQSFIK